ncbi:quinol:cytochrome C oxidoreductase [Lacihabitans sp. CCS-44]|uniref:quinol:cytochrome C oxidoreductase n=1 Tax=Lacihabitans sp. CCS-44 TaxID=2487331 RepID=UPI0020CFE594|nr:quinol:cytochrome C oxidoreductase [Lacihabitans sp. CCS-44]MCP9755774.1 quinol:cytochrome C oxidoreductase [Lacihabitans sp. CCS-44]
MAHKHETPSLDESFDFSPELRKKLIISAIIGIAMVALGAFLIKNHWSIGVWDAGHGAEHAAEGHGGGEHHGATLFSRIVANLWMNSVYFLGISVVGVFFLSYNYVAKAGWYASFKRVPEAFPSFIIVPALVMLALFLYPDTRNIIFHWTHHGIMEVGSENYDKIIAGKSWYLNFPFFLVRMVAYFGVWYYLWTQIRKYSLLEDETNDLAYYYKSRNYAKMFLIFFAVTSSTAAWDFSMSIDTHWFSTMFGWYHLASWHVAGLAAMMLTILLLKDKGYLKAVTFSSIHDLGKLMFGFSVFWTYVWFSQFLLIFYANLPEETIYFRERFSGHGGRYFAPFIINLILNFVFPFLILMARESKRNMTFLKLACGSILVGHWFDFYQIQMPGIAKDQGGIGIIEWGTTLTFASLFIYFVANQLSKANLIPKNHPFIEESLHHDI